jgi:hypothetical protein
MSAPLPDDEPDRPVDPHLDEPSGERPEPAADRGRWGLLREALLVGLGVSVLSLLVVTAVPALTAGVAHVRRYVTGRPATVAALWEDFRAACRGVWLVAIGVPVLLAALLVNLQLVGADGAPRSAGVQVATGFLAAILLVVVLRAAAGWAPGARWGAVVQAAAKRAGDDLPGTGVLVVVLALCAVMVWAVVPLVVIVPGLLSLTVVAVEHRATVRGR